MPTTAHRLPNSAIRRRFSPLTLRILAVNALAVVILIGGLFYLGLYQGQLVDKELNVLGNEAKLFAALIAEGAIEVGTGATDEGFSLNSAEARTMVRRLRSTLDTQVILLDGTGSVMADSSILEGDVEVTPLPPPPTHGFKNVSESLGRLADWLDRLAVSAGPLTQLPDNPKSLPATERAMQGISSGSAWQRPDGRVALVAAAPVQRLKQVLGAVVLIRDGKQIDRSVVEVRRNIFQISLISLSVTALMSIYLARAIDRPLRVLAQAADVVRRSTTRNVELPDFSSRKDEIGDLSTALRDMTNSLWSRLDAIESFAADVSHELKNPLASIRSALDTLPMIKDEEKRERLLRVVQHDVQRLDRLITDISDASRLDAEMSRLSHEPFNLVKTLTILHEIHESTFEQDKTIGIPMVFTNRVGKRMMVDGNESRLVQVIQNLITNAISFSPEGGEVRVTLGQVKGMAEILVEDDGPGIPEAKLETIFSRFYSERPKGESFGSHSGLGLSISRQIIGAHKGLIFARNRKGPDGIVLGAQFVVRLPLPA